jgi:hypothetical protein
VTLCGSSKNQRFGGRYHIDHQGEKNQRVSFFHSLLQLLVTATVVPSTLIFSTDDRGDILLRNIGSYKNRTASHPRIRNSSEIDLASGTLRFLVI